MTPASVQEADPVDAGPWHPAALKRARRDVSRSRNWFSPLLRRLYRFRRLRPLVLGLCERLEGGSIHSATLRDLLRNPHGVEVGRYSYGDVLIPGRLPRGTRVGAYCSVGTELIVRRRDHPLDRPSLHPFFYNRRLGYVMRDTIPTGLENPLEIGHDVWIGDRVTILAGCRRIGNGAVLAAGAVVTRDVDPYTVVAGVPARPLRRRFDEVAISRIEATRWWEHDIASLVADPPLPGMVGPVSSLLAQASAGLGSLSPNDAENGARP